MKFEDLNHGDIFILTDYTGLSVYMKIPNVLKDNENKLQKNAVVLYGIWRGNVIKFSESQEVMRLDRK